MRTLALSAAAAALVASGALAQTMDDLPAGTEWDQQTVSEVFPALADEATFIAVDSDADGMISRNELQAAMDSGDL